MSKDIYTRAGLIVTRYVGAVSDGPDRARWQVMAYPHDFATLTRDDVQALVLVLLRDVEE